MALKIFMRASTALYLLCLPVAAIKIAAPFDLNLPSAPAPKPKPAPVLTPPLEQGVLVGAGTAATGHSASSSTSSTTSSSTSPQLNTALAATFAPHKPPILPVDPDDVPHLIHLSYATIHVALPFTLRPHPALSSKPKPLSAPTLALNPGITAGAGTTGTAHASSAASSMAASSTPPNTALVVASAPLPMKELPKVFVHSDYRPFLSVWKRWKAEPKLQLEVGSSAARWQTEFDEAFSKVFTLPFSQDDTIFQRLNQIYLNGYSFLSPYKCDLARLCRMLMMFVNRAPGFSPSENLQSHSAALRGSAKGLIDDNDVDPSLRRIARFYGARVQAKRLRDARIYLTGATIEAPERVSQAFDELSRDAGDDTHLQNEAHLYSMRFLLLPPPCLTATSFKRPKDMVTSTYFNLRKLFLSPSVESNLRHRIRLYLARVTYEGFTTELPYPQAISISEAWAYLTETRKDEAADPDLRVKAMDYQTCVARWNWRTPALFAARRALGGSFEVELEHATVFEHTFFEKSSNHVHQMAQMANLELRPDLPPTRMEDSAFVGVTEGASFMPTFSPSLSAASPPKSGPTKEDKEDK